MKKELFNVTLVGIDTYQHELCVEALKRSCKDIDFHKVLFLSDKKLNNLPENIDFLQISQIKDACYDYSRFVLYELVNYIESDFCIIVHADGYITNAERWDDDFLNYDYIGSPWKKIGDGYDNRRVGNGGFSLRSKRLLEYCKYTNHKLNSNEDILICKVYGQALEKLGIKFAPIEVASKFAQEEVLDDIDVDVRDCFGFHGKEYTPFHKEACEKLRSLL